ncbi:ATP11 protein-domain-containing protein [Blastocladiella britannica]|nr:ATP11 protein-domain-containing protein [Blastocladiella britannica]
MPKKRHNTRRVLVPTASSSPSSLPEFAPISTENANTLQSQAAGMLRPSTFHTAATVAQWRVVTARSAATLAGVTVGPSPQVRAAAHESARRAYAAPSPDFELKYQEKLLDRAKAQGFTSVQAMLDSYKQRRAQEELEARRVAAAKEKAEAASLAAEVSKGDLPPHVKKLNDIMVMEKLAEESQANIEKLWLAFHAPRDNIAAVIERDTYLLMHSRAKKYPMFVLPVFRNPQDPSEAENYLVQHSGHQSHFTSMLSYKTHGAEAPVLFTLTYYTDLVDSKGMVLVHGEGDTKALPLEVMKRLTQGMRNFYVSEEYALVEMMYQNPAEFSFDAVLAVVRARMDAGKLAREEEAAAAAATAGTVGESSSTPSNPAKAE